MLTQADQYYIQAKDEYPYNLEDTLENLQRALGVDDEHPGALYLMGRLIYEQLNDSGQAEDYYQLSLQANPNYWLVYYHYAELLIKQERFAKAYRLIQFGKEQSEARKDWFLRQEAQIAEFQRKYKEAIDLLREAQLVSVYDTYIEQLEADCERIKKKRKRVEKPDAKKSEKKKKQKK